MGTAPLPGWPSTPTSTLAARPSGDPSRLPGSGQLMGSAVPLEAQLPPVLAPASPSKRVGLSALAHVGDMLQTLRVTPSCCRHSSRPGIAPLRLVPHNHVPPSRIASDSRLPARPTRCMLEQRDVTLQGGSHHLAADVWPVVSEGEAQLEHRASVAPTAAPAFPGATHSSSEAFTACCVRSVAVAPGQPAVSAAPTVAAAHDLDANRRLRLSPGMPPSVSAAVLLTTTRTTTSGGSAVAPGFPGAQQEQQQPTSPPSRAHAVSCTTATTAAQTESQAGASPGTRHPRPSRSRSSLLGSAYMMSSAFGAAPQPTLTRGATAGSASGNVSLLGTGQGHPVRALPHPPPAPGVGGAPASIAQALGALVAASRNASASTRRGQYHRQQQLQHPYHGGGRAAMNTGILSTAALFATASALGGQQGSSGVESWELCGGGGSANVAEQLPTSIGATLCTVPWQELRAAAAGAAVTTRTGRGAAAIGQ
jgi:hypothetical protein